MNLSGSPIDYLWAFLGGIFASLTPCIYPLIPITAGFIGTKVAGSRLKGFTLSFIYVTGIAITYSLLGLVASLTGKIFGAISSSPITHFLVGIIIILFGLSMLEAFTLSLPNLIKLPKLKKQNYFSSFLLGLSSGLVIGPCLTPILGAILTHLVARKNILYGMTLLFTFAYGMGLLLILVGVFSSLLLNLPKSGKWMNYIKKISAFILIGMGAYFVYSGLVRFLG